MHYFIVNSSWFNGFGRWVSLWVLPVGILWNGSTAAPANAAASSNSEIKFIAFFGTYTGAKSKGIYSSQFDAATGTLSPPQLAAEIQSPSFLAIDPSERFLYAVNEVGEFKGEKAGAVTAYSIQKSSGALTRLNQESARGTGPCHLVVDSAGKNVLVANYGGGSVAVLPIGEGGKLRPSTSFIQHQGSSVNPGRQKEPHAHSINLDPSGKFACVADLGLDQVVIYKFDAQAGTIVPNNPPFARVKPGAGPRHFSFHPNGRFAYVINELDSTITAFGFDGSNGALKEMQSLTTLPAEGAKENSTAEIRVHPTGQFVYGSNRGHNSIAVFRVDADSGKLTWVENEPTQGEIPRNFNLDPTGRWLLVANQKSDSVVVFKVDPSTGALTPGNSRIEIGQPVCIRFAVMR